MAMNDVYTATAPALADVQALQGATLLEFGTAWCGHCQAAQPKLAKAFADHDSVRHLKIEDGSGRPLGRAFRVKLWPTLIFLRDGQELARLVRPNDVAVISEAFTKIDP